MKFGYILDVLTSAPNLPYSIPLGMQNSEWLAGVGSASTPRAGSRCLTATIHFQSTWCTPESAWRANATSWWRCAGQPNARQLHEIKNKYSIPIRNGNGDGWWSDNVPADFPPFSWVDMRTTWSTPIRSASSVANVYGKFTNNIVASPWTISMTDS